MKRARNDRRKRGSPALTPAVTDGAPQTIVVPVLAPRNPFQALARSRKGGAHDLDARKRRRIEKRELRQKISDG